jgi:hypothetical protein
MRIFGPKRDEVKGGWRKLHDEEMGRACSTNGERGVHIGFWWESRKERNHYEDLDVGGSIIVEWILEGWAGGEWTGLIWLRIGTSGEFL